MDIEQARLNMITQQVRAWDVFDDKVLNLIKKVPRETFVPESYCQLAFADMNIPIGDGEVMMTPKEEGHLIQALDIKPHEQVLEVGTGSGYVTTLLALLAKKVISVDINPNFLTPAAEKLTHLGVSNVTLTTGDAAQGWDQEEDYDVIAITGSLPLLPQKFRDQLRIGGRLFAIIGQAPAMEATLITRTGKDEWQQQKLFETVIPVLHDALQPSPFKF